MFKKLILTIVVLGLIFGGFFYVKSKQFAGQEMPAFPPEKVTAMEAREMVWERTIPAIGSLRAEQGIQVAAEVSGIVRKIHFESGQQVSKGEVMIEINTSVEEAELVSAQAAEELAQITLERSRELRKKNTIPQSELDAAEAQAKQTAANVETIRARIDLKTIEAPFDGRLGIRTLDPGEFISAGQSIVSLQSLDPILLDFTLPQNRLSRVEVGLPVRIRVDSWENESFRGEINALNPEVDRTTRTFQLEAKFPNPDGKLRPGMFAKVEIILPESDRVVAIPLTAVYNQSYGDSIFAVVPADEGDGLVAEQRFVRLGRSQGDFVSVLEGLETGERVVTTGVFKLSNGRGVVIDNELQPDFALNPTPPNR